MPPFSRHKSELFSAQRGCFLLRVLPLSFPLKLLGRSSILHLHLLPQAGDRDHLLVPKEGMCPSHAHFTCQRRDPCGLGGEVVHVGFGNQSHLVSGFWCKVAEHEAAVSPRHLLCPLPCQVSCWGIFQGVVASFLGEEFGPQQAEAARGDVCGMEPVGLDDIWKRDSGRESLLTSTPRTRNTCSPSPSGWEMLLAAALIPEVTKSPWKSPTSKTKPLNSCT